MDANLVCKIVAETVSDGKYRGSGYPITPNRIITAAHVVDDAAPIEGHTGKAGIRQIELSFGVNEAPLQVPVAIEWSGTRAGVDIAVLRCELPAELQPGHELLMASSNKLIEWCARGYTEFGKAKREGGKDAYYGKLAPFAEDEPTVALGCEDGPVSSSQWAGGSGSVAFDSATAPRAVAVITDYQGGRQQDHLLAVTLGFLLNSEQTGTAFREAIQFGAYQQRERYRDQCIETIGAMLQDLENKDLPKQLAVEILRDFLDGDEPDIDPEGGRCAQQIASYIVNRMDVMDAVGCLFRFMQKIGGHDAEQIDAAMNRLLSLNFAPAAVRRLQAQLDHNQFGLVENEVATRTAAEIIMAGLDQKPAKFVMLADEEPTGLPALSYHPAPEEGPGSEADFLVAVRTQLQELLREKDRVLELPVRAEPTQGASPARIDIIEREIKTYATQLRGALSAFKRGIHQGRRMYCLMTLPEEPVQREFRKRVLRKICKHVPDLIFIELMADSTDDREYEVETYVKMRLIHSQQGQES